MYSQFLQMKELCKSAQGVGLSAVQVGIPLQCFIAKIRKQWRYFLNCSYSGDGPKTTSLEGCLSFPGRFEVRRYEIVTVKGFEFLESSAPASSPSGLSIVPLEEMFAGLDGFIMQHEIDHHEGILISDIGQELEVW